MHARRALFSTDPSCECVCLKNMALCAVVFFLVGWLWGDAISQAPVAAGERIFMSLECEY